MEEQGTVLFPLKCYSCQFRKAKLSEKREVFVREKCFMEVMSRGQSEVLFSSQFFPVIVVGQVFCEGKVIYV